MTENQFWHVNLLLLMYLDRNALAVIEDRNQVVLAINIHLDRFHIRISYLRN